MPFLPSFFGKEQVDSCSMREHEVIATSEEKGNTPEGGTKE